MAASAASASMELRLRLDEMSGEEARELLLRCCGSTRWADRMAARRPFGNRDTLIAAARNEWLALSDEDWLEAF